MSPCMHPYMRQCTYISFSIYVDELINSLHK